jgi:lia operon protein LiaG
MKRILGVVCILFGLAVGWASLGPPGLLSERIGSGETDEQTVESSVDHIKQIRVKTSRMPVEIKSENVDTLQATLLKQGNSRSTVHVNEQGDRLQISADSNAVWLWDWIPSLLAGNSGERATLVISVPEDYDQSLHLEGTSGNYTLSDMHNLQELDIDISSAHVQVENVQTEQFSYDASSGTLDAEGLVTEQSDLTFSSGKATLDGVEGEIKGRSSSGSILMSVSTVEHPIAWEASSGSITLQVTEEADFDLEASMSSGSFDSDFPIKLHAQSNRNVEGQVGDGGEPVKLKVSSGKIKIEQP